MSHPKSRDKGRKCRRGAVSDSSTTLSQLGMGTGGGGGDILTLSSNWWRWKNPTPAASFFCAKDRSDTLVHLTIPESGLSEQ